MEARRAETKPPAKALKPQCLEQSADTIRAFLPLFNYNECEQSGCLIDQVDVEWRPLSSTVQPWIRLQVDDLEPKTSWEPSDEGEGNKLVRKHVPKWPNIRGQHLAGNPGDSDTKEILRLTANLKDLFPYQLYEIRQRTHNIKGWSEWSDEGMCRTSSAVWKCALEETVYGDPKIAGTCLEADACVACDSQ